MRPYRTWLSILLGLTLLLQGFAVSSALRDDLVEPAAAQMSAAAGLPCHGQTDEPAGAQSAACCDASCPDMTSCALGHLATASVPSVWLSHDPRPDAPALAGPVIAAAPALLLRPPIARHG